MGQMGMKTCAAILFLTVTGVNAREYLQIQFFADNDTDCSGTKDTEFTHASNVCGQAGNDTGSFHFKFWCNDNTWSGSIGETTEACTAGANFDAVDFDACHSRTVNAETMNLKVSKVEIADDVKAVSFSIDGDSWAPTMISGTCQSYTDKTSGLPRSLMWTALSGSPEVQFQHWSSGFDCPDDISPSPQTTVNGSITLGLPYTVTSRPTTPSDGCDKNCQGAWTPSTCAADCSDQTYQITTQAAGTGTACPESPRPCSPGTGDCTTSGAATLWSVLTVAVAALVARI